MAGPRMHLRPENQNVITVFLTDWPAAVSGEADKKLTLSASACHIGEPNSVNLGQKHTKKLNIPSPQEKCKMPHAMLTFSNPNRSRAARARVLMYPAINRPWAAAKNARAP